MNYEQTVTDNVAYRRSLFVNFMLLILGEFITFLILFMFNISNMNPNFFLNQFLSLIFKMNRSQSSQAKIDFCSEIH